MRKKKLPLRKCVVCGERKPKKELIRIVRTSDNQIVVDLTGKQNGRGAYICPNINCYEMGIKSKKLARIFGEEVPAEVLDTLEVKIKEHIDGLKSL